MTTNQTQPTFKFARIGSISSGTLRTPDLLATFASELESLVFANGAFYALPENRSERDRLNNLVGEAQDCFAEDGDTIDPEKEEIGAELVDDLINALQEFAPPYCVFGTAEGDGADFGFWPDIESAKEQCEFVSAQSYRDARAIMDLPPADFRGEWLHVNDHGNVTLYVRDENGSDREIWSLV